MGASLCPSGNCSGNCEMPFEQETNKIGSRGWSTATLPSSAFAWCSSRCNVWRHKGCCYHPTCRQRRSRACRWMNYLTGTTSSSFSNFSPSYRFHDLFQKLGALTITIQGRLAHSQAACPMATGLVRCRRFQSTAPPSWTKMRSHTQVRIQADGTSEEVNS